MSDEPKPFGDLPGFKETIARIARVPSEASTKVHREFTYSVLDATNKITYKIVSQRILTPADIRRTLARAFARTDAWPNEAGEIEIRA
jgi:hypothetical protein